MHQISGSDHQRVAKKAVKNQWNGMIQWNTGMEYWNGLINAKKLSYFGLVMKIINRGANLQEGTKM